MRFFFVRRILSDGNRGQLISIFIIKINYITYFLVNQGQPALTRIKHQVVSTMLNKQKFSAASGEYI